MGNVKIAPPPRRYIFNKMHVGDKVFIRDGLPQGREAVAARVLAHYRRTRGQPCKFSIRRVTDGIEVWRVE